MNKYAAFSCQPIYSHYNVLPVIDVFAATAGRDLRGVLKDIKPIPADMAAVPP